MRAIVLVFLVACKSGSSAPDAAVEVEPNRACTKDVDCMLTGACGCPHDVCPLPPEAINAAHVANYRAACLMHPCPPIDAAAITTDERAKCPRLPSAWAAKCTAGRCTAIAR